VEVRTLLRCSIPVCRLAEIWFNRETLEIWNGPWVSRPDLHPWNKVSAKQSKPTSQYLTKVSPRPTACWRTGLAIGTCPWAHRGSTRWALRVCGQALLSWVSAAELPSKRTHRRLRISSTQWLTKWQRSLATLRTCFTKLTWVMWTIYPGRKWPGARMASLKSCSPWRISQ